MNIILAQTVKEGKNWLKANNLEGKVVTPRTINSVRGVTGTKFYLAGNIRLTLHHIQEIAECFTHLPQNPVHVVLPVMNMLDQVAL